MSTVLWSNSLKNGEVVSNQEDLHAMYKHLGKLNALCEQMGLRPLGDFCDDTDLLVNSERLEMPEGFDDTNQMMAAQGVWADATEAAAVLEKLLNHVESNRTRFGLLANRHGDMVNELRASLQFARSAAEAGAKFNFAIVM